MEAHQARLSALNIKVKQMLKPESGNAIAPALAKTMGSRASADVLQGYLSGQALPVKTPTGDLLSKHRHRSLVQE